MIHLPPTSPSLDEPTPEERAREGSAPPPHRAAADEDTLGDEALRDTVAEPELDALTALAARLLDVPIALVMLCDGERTWLKSRYGLEAPQLPRAGSFCDVVVGENAPLTVEDARADPRFREHPLVTGPQAVRFYAGMPLRTAEGQPVGTLCVLGPTPRRLSGPDLSLLELVAMRVMAQLDLRRQARTLARERRTAATLLQFFQLGHDLLCTVGPEGALEELNPAWETTLGFLPEVLRAKPILDWVHPEDHAATRAAGARARGAPGTIVPVENRLLHAAGHWVPLAWSITLHEGTLYATARDLTHRREREHLLALSNAQVVDSAQLLSSTFASMTEGIVLQDAAGVITTCNPAAETILGLSQAQMMGLASTDPQWRATRSDGSPFPGSEHPAMVALATGQPQRDVRMGVQQPSGDRTWISINAQPLLRGEPPRPHAVVVTFRDITVEVLAQDALARERAFLDAVLANIPDTLVGIFNAKLEVEFSFGTLRVPNAVQVGTSPSAGLSPENRPRFDAAARACLEGHSPMLELVERGHRFQTRFMPLPGGRGLALAHDVTAHDALREQVHRRERLVTAGTLTSGIGHEVNNPLAYVMANLEFALEEVRALAGPKPSSQLTELLDVLTASRGGAERIKKIVRGLRAFARAESEPGAVALPELLEVAANLAQHALRLRATLRLQLSPTPEVFAEEPRLTQVFVNLLVSAAQRFPTQAPSTNRVWVRSGLTAEGSVFVDVLDNGPTIAPEVLAHLFDASVPDAQHPIDGLGLAVSHAVAAAFGGNLTCTSGGGETCFRLTLQRASARPPSKAVELPRSRVLVIDDEPEILTVLGRLLRDEHEVVVEADAERALALLLDDQQHFDVVFCDLVMPKRTGVQLYWEVQRKDPALAGRFVLMTGGVVNDGIRDFLAAVKNPRPGEALRGERRAPAGRAKASAFPL